MHRNNKNNKPKKPSITLMTILACERPRESNKILEEYGYSKTNNVKELEKKLAQLHSNCDDKVELEKKLASIHPHRKWLLKLLSPPIPEPKNIIVQPDPPVSNPKVDIDTIKRIENLEQRSSFFGPKEQSSSPTQNKANDNLIIIGTVAMVTMLGFIVLTIQTKK